MATQLDPEMWRTVEQTGQAVRPLAGPGALQSRTDKLRGPDSEWQRAGQTEQRVADPVAPHSRTDKPGRKAGSEADHTTQGSITGDIKPQTSD